LSAELTKKAQRFPVSEKRNSANDKKRQTVERPIFPSDLDIGPRFHHFWTTFDHHTSTSGTSDRETTNKARISLSMDQLAG